MVMVSPTITMATFGAPTFFAFATAPPPASSTVPPFEETIAKLPLSAVTATRSRIIGPTQAPTSAPTPHPAAASAPAPALAPTPGGTTSAAATTTTTAASGARRSAGPRPTRVLIMSSVIASAMAVTVSAGARARARATSSITTTHPSRPAPVAPAKLVPFDRPHCLNYELNCTLVLKSCHYIPAMPRSHIFSTYPPPCSPGCWLVLRFVRFGPYTWQAGGFRSTDGRRCGENARLSKQAEGLCSSQFSAVHQHGAFQEFSKARPNSRLTAALSHTRISYRTQYRVHYLTNASPVCLGSRFDPELSRR
mmetsp:Transcript_38706/g.79073  ORF Transcript_38706/g.79073 Transcript_38706/m.79073 type:complete len:308 (-) Transcript_38706:19-942(-)